jgi:hypothetical protein
VTDSSDDDGLTRLVSHFDSPRSFAVLAMILTIGLLIALTLSTPGNVKDAVTALALLIGGGWTLYQFALRRSFESCLSIDVAVTTAPSGELFAISIDTTLHNTGNRRIAAPAVLTAAQITSYEESIAYPCDLQIRRVPDIANGFVDWWSSKAPLIPVPNVPEHISLLYEYSRRDGDVDFFMEPAEQYHLGAVFVLPPGHYLAKVVFVGSRGAASEFWSRIISFHVPATSPDLPPRNAGTSTA